MKNRKRHSPFSCRRSAAHGERQFCPTARTLNTDQPSGFAPTGRVQKYIRPRRYVHLCLPSGGDILSDRPRCSGSLMFVSSWESQHKCPLFYQICPRRAAPKKPLWIYMMPIRASSLSVPSLWYSDSGKSSGSKLTCRRRPSDVMCKTNELLSTFKARRQIAHLQDNSRNPVTILAKHSAESFTLQSLQSSSWNVASNSVKLERKRIIDH